MIRALTTLLTLSAPASEAPAEPTEPIAAEPIAAEPTATEPAPSSEPAPAGAPEEEADPWAPSTEPLPSAPPAEEAVLRQSDPELADALKAPKKKGYARYASPQRFATEVKFGPFIPDIDRNYHGSDEFGPYAKIFGQTDDRGITTAEPKKGLLTALAFEWQFLNPGGIGPLGLGYTFSFFRDKAQALLVDPPADGSVRSGADKTTFTVLPMALQLVFRFELLADRVNIPIVPYVKGGLAYAFWWSKNGDGNLSTNSMGVKARGGAWGWQINAGGMLRLDFLDVNDSRTLDRLTGINHTYVFGEYQLSRINNFGRANSISLGAGTWLLGLAIEF
ncbi:MAG: MXAN_2562 family outer membrane beta-barrel protein [Nannocystaceae bacterium]